MDRYEEALERAKKGLPIDEVFPELKESEDERIRKILIHIVKGACDKYGIKYKGDEITEEKLLAYLEKQKAKERLNRMAPIYNDKDSFESALEKAWKYYNESASRTVDSFEDDYIECVFSKGFREGFLYKEKQKEQKPESCDCSRDEESYTNGIHHVLMNPEAYGLIKQKPAEWSEEDERKRQACISTINEVIDYERERWEDYNPGKPYRPIMKYDEQIDWLKSLRPQPHWKPSEVQMEALENSTALNEEQGAHLYSLLCDLKKLL